MVFAVNDTKPGSSEAYRPRLDRDRLVLVPLDVPVVSADDIHLALQYFVETIRFRRETSVPLSDTQAL